MKKNYDSSKLFVFLVNINECASNPCMHGVCNDEANGFTCTCDAGYSGDTCNGEI